MAVQYRPQLQVDPKADRSAADSVAGGEYFFSPRFSVGGEVRLDYFRLSVTQTSAQATVRWYLRHRNWCETVQSGSYDRERLGLEEST